VIEHAQLDLLAAALATQAGANIQTNQNITPQNFIELIPQYERLIGADGALSLTRKFLGLPNPQFWLGIQYFEQKIDTNDWVETWATQNGFYGVFLEASK